MNSILVNLGILEDCRSEIRQRFRWEHIQRQCFQDDYVFERTILKHLEHVKKKREGPQDVSCISFRKDTSDGDELGILIDPDPSPRRNTHTWEKEMEDCMAIEDTVTAALPPASKPVSSPATAAARGRGRSRGSRTKAEAGGQWWRFSH